MTYLDILKITDPKEWQKIIKRFMPNDYFDYAWDRKWDDKISVSSLECMIKGLVEHNNQLEHMIAAYKGIKVE